MRDILLEFADIVAQESVKEFDELNKCREMQGLSNLKRLNGASTKRAIRKILNPISDNDLGSQGESVENPSGENMSKDNSAIKSDNSELEVKQ